MKPDYYKGSQKRDVIDIIKELDLNFNLGNVLKYITRTGRKPSADITSDLTKAIEYLNREISYLEEGKTPVKEVPLKKEYEEKLTSLEFMTLLLKSVENLTNYPELREGQSLMNCLFYINPKLYKSITNTKNDPFTDDKNIEGFLNIIYDREEE